MDNADGLLRPGMSATVALPLGDETGNVVTVPLASVQRVGTGWVVFLPRKEEGHFDVRAIGRGRELGGEVEVLSGLRAGELVVVDGSFLLKAESDKARGEGGGHEH
jgi:cobalt-zinc-cadmium efflux system membrane fusion protein